jgi:predicted nucleotidyltransferase
MGSVAYGVSSDNSDVDLYGFCIPTKEIIFPHLAGVIPGFGRQGETFWQFEKHHAYDSSANSGKGCMYDMAVYSIVKYFNLCMQNNPNMIDSLFTPSRCVRHITQVGHHVRDNRKIFLHKGCWHKFKGYAYSQLSKMKNKVKEGKRQELIDKHGYDTKFAYHVVRLINEVEQILTEGDLTLDRNREQLKAIRRGEWTEQQVRDWFDAKEVDLGILYNKSDLQHSPNESRIKTLLLECLEIHFGSLDKCIRVEDEAVNALRDIGHIVAKVLVS